MRIAIFSDFSPVQLSGIGDSIKTLMENLAKKGHTVRLYTSGYPEPFVSEVGNNGVCTLPSFGLPRNPDHRVVVPIGGMKDVRSFKPDVLHVHTTGIIGLWALHVAKKLRVPLVGTDHTFPADYLHYVHLNIRPMRHVIRYVAAWFYRHCIVVTAPSNAMLQELHAYRMHRKSLVISNPIETDFFHILNHKDSIKARLGLTGFVVLLFGRIAKEKNVSESMQVFALAMQKGLKGQLLVVGDGPERRHLEEQAHTLGVADHVRFLGMLKREDLVEAINAADAYLITSRSETQSMCTLQAMSCGLPAVGVDQGALPEYIRHGESGYIGKAGDCNQLADFLISLMQDDKKRSAFAHAGRTIAQQYSPHAITEEFEKVYREAIEVSSKSLHRSEVVKRAF